MFGWPWVGSLVMHSKWESGSVYTCKLIVDFIECFVVDDLDYGRPVVVCVSFYDVLRGVGVADCGLSGRGEVIIIVLRFFSRYLSRRLDISWIFLMDVWARICGYPGLPLPLILVTTYC